VAPSQAIFVRSFQFFQLARLCGILGAEIEALVMGWQVYALTHDPLHLGFVGLAQFLPSMIFFMLSGHLADRFNRRNIVLTTLIGRVFCTFLFFTFIYFKLTLLWPIYTILVTIGLLRAFGGPAWQSLMPDLVEKEQVQNAITWSSTVFQCSTIVGPAIGGLLYGVAENGVVAYACTVFLFILATLLLTQVKPKKQHITKPLHSDQHLWAGLKYVWQHPIIFGTLSLDLFAVLLGGAVALLPIYAREILHIGPMGLGLLRSAPALGALCMALIIAKRPIARAGRTMFLGVSVFGLAVIVFSLSRWPWLSLLALFISGGADELSVVIRSTLVQIKTPAHMRGRVSAVNLLFVGASNEFGQFESGLTAKWFGPVRAALYGGIGTLCVVALWAFKFKALRQARFDKTSHLEDGD